MPLYTELPPEIEEVDVIIAGGGTAACVVAARLADAEPNLSILVVESGSTNVGEPTIAYPLLFLAHLDPTSKYMRLVKAGKSTHVADRELVLPAGNVLGGGSSVNMLTYSRGYSYDFDAWNMPGWSASEVLPYLKKFESYHGPGKDAVHGKDGPIAVSKGPYEGLKIQDDFVAAATKIGFPEHTDLQGIDGALGVQRNMKYVSTDGKRQDVASRYLLPRVDSGTAGLHVLLEAKVDRVLFDDGKKANGVVFTTTREGGEPRTVRAKRQVVISCGTLGSPLLLERSGVGRAEILDAAGVPLVAENNGVGEGFQDHLLIMSTYKTNLEPDDTLDTLVRGEFDVPGKIQSGDPIMGWTAMDAICQIRPNDEEVAALGPEFQKTFDKYWGSEPQKAVAVLTAVNTFPGPPPPVLPRGQYLTTTAFSTYPFARGHLHVTGPKPDDPCSFDTGFLADENDIDLKMLRYIYKTKREIIRRMDLYRGELDLMHPPFAADSTAALHDGPLEGEIKNLEYSAEDDKVLDQWIRGTVSTTWHGLGTCKMAPREEGGAVDERLDVYGVKGLKVADLSVIPGNVAANTYNTALLIGEKVSDMLIEELGLAK